jgi:flagellar biosynthesis/type III secretory pathway chaperone
MEWKTKKKLEEPNWAKTFISKYVVQFFKTNPRVVTINLVQIWEQVITYTTNVTINNMNNFSFLQKKFKSSQKEINSISTRNSNFY